MGIQNSFVTKISNAIVRTTHLTGLFTDLGAGGLIGGLFYSRFNLKLNTLIFGALILLISLFYDDLRYRLIKTKRKYNQRKITAHKTL